MSSPPKSPDGPLSPSSDLTTEQNSSELFLARLASKDHAIQTQALGRQGGVGGLAGASSEAHWTSFRNFVNSAKPFLPHIGAILGVDDIETKLLPKEYDLEAFYHRKLAPLQSHDAIKESISRFHHKYFPSVVPRHMGIALTFEFSSGFVVHGTLFSDLRAEVSNLLKSLDPCFQACMVEFVAATHTTVTILIKRICNPLFVVEMTQMLSDSIKVMGGSARLYKLFHTDGGAKLYSNCFRVNVIFQILCSDFEMQRPYLDDLKFISEIFNSMYAFFFYESPRPIRDANLPDLCTAKAKSSNPRLAELYDSLLKKTQHKKVHTSSGSDLDAGGVGWFSCRFQELYMAILIVWGGTPASVFDRDAVITVQHTKRNPEAHMELRKRLYDKLDLSTFSRLISISKRQVATLGFWILQTLEDVGSLLFVMQADCGKNRVGDFDLGLDLREPDSDFLVSNTNVDSDRMYLDAFVVNTKKVNDNAWKFIQDELLEAHRSIAAGLHIETLPFVQRRLYNAWNAILALESNAHVVRAFEYASIYNNRNSMSAEPMRHQYLMTIYTDVKEDESTAWAPRFFSQAYSKRDMAFNVVLFREYDLLDIDNDPFSVRMICHGSGSVEPIQAPDVRNITPSMHRGVAVALQMYTIRSMYVQLWDMATLDICKGLARDGKINKNDEAINTLFHSFRRIKGDYEVPAHISKVKNILAELDKTRHTSTCTLGPNMPDLKAIHDAGLRLSTRIKTEPLCNLMDNPYASNAGARSRVSARDAAATSGAGAAGGAGAAADYDEYHLASDEDLWPVNEAEMGTAEQRETGADAGNLGIASIILDKHWLSPSVHIVTIDSVELPTPIFGGIEEEAINNALNMLVGVHDLHARDAKFGKHGFILIRSEENYMTVRLKMNRKGFVINFFHETALDVYEKHGLLYFKSGVVWSDTTSPLFEMEVQTSKILRNPVNLDWNIITSPCVINEDIRVHFNKFKRDVDVKKRMEMKRIGQYADEASVLLTSQEDAVCTKRLDPDSYKDMIVLCRYNPMAPQRGLAKWKFTVSLSKIEVEEWGKHQRKDSKRSLSDEVTRDDDPKRKCVKTSYAVVDETTEDDEEF